MARHAGSDPQVEHRRGVVRMLHEQLAAGARDGDRAAVDLDLALALEHRPGTAGLVRAAVGAGLLGGLDRQQHVLGVLRAQRLEIWDFYGNEGWPARYLWDRQGALHSLHYGEGAYQETEREIQALLGVERELLAPLRPEDAADVLLPAQTADQPGAYSGPYEAGGAWAVLDGEGEVTANGRTFAVAAPGCFALLEHPHHTAGVLELRVGEGVWSHATCFTPGVAAPGDRGRPAAG